MVNHAAPIAPTAHEPRLQTHCRALSSWAPRVDPVALMSQNTEEPTYLWGPPKSPTWVGIGCQYKFTSQGPGRFIEQKRQSQELLSHIEGFSLDGAPAPHPRLFGGFAFSEESLPEESPWAGFSNSEFILPKWSYECDEERAWITVYYSESDNPEALRQAALSRLQELQLEPSPNALKKDGAQCRTTQEPIENWAKRIEAIQALCPL